jgi:hypothetical protein
MSGILAVTDRRLVFATPKQPFAWQFDEIAGADVTPGSVMTYLTVRLRDGTKTEYVGFAQKTQMEVVAQAINEEAGDAPVDGSPEPGAWRAVLAAGERASRTLTVQLGSETHTVEYRMNTVAANVVTVDGEKVLSIGAMHGEGPSADGRTEAYPSMTSVREIYRFGLSDGPQEHPAVIEMSAGGLGKIRSFTLTVGDQVLYRE